MLASGLFCTSEEVRHLLLNVRNTRALIFSLLRWDFFAHAPDNGCWYPVCCRAWFPNIFLKKHYLAFYRYQLAVIIKRSVTFFSSTMLNKIFCILFTLLHISNAYATRQKRLVEKRSEHILIKETRNLICWLKKKSFLKENNLNCGYLQNSSSELRKVISIAFENSIIRITLIDTNKRIAAIFHFIWFLKTGFWLI